MALVGPNFVFYRIPRTGGTWVTHALRGAYDRNGLTTVDIPHSFPPGTVRAEGKLKFTIVRGWRDWCRSWEWMLDNRGAGLRQNVPPELLERPLCAEKCILPYLCGVDRILHTERLDEDLRQLLRDLGKDPGIVDGIPERAKNSTEILACQGAGVR